MYVLMPLDPTLPIRSAPQATPSAVYDEIKLFHLANNILVAVGVVLEKTENCYIDTPSVCDEPNSVPCTNLASGTKQACCPRLTSCHDPFEASEDQVRCNIRHIDLKNAARAAENTVNSSSTRTSSSTSTTSTSTSSTISTDSLSLSTTSASTGNAANATGTPSPSMSPSSGGGVSAGVIAGAVIGATCFIAALVLLGCFFYRRRAKSGGPKHELPAQGMTSSYSQQHSPYPTIGPYYHEYKPYGAANLPIGPDGYPAVHNAPVEVASTNAGGNYYAAELPTTR
ncbi:hypothetical protein QBC38DRAFT_462320 [Podospora fimiseda]|uniref:Mid2 domain-containing protein n=1 Tax=Podospora fimiseda TaxID=252190 RepID=A0AAN7BET5_9PEZI|nr:hypothetical protein QBC38DRAFT_462320 [Podospora fimiseda]